MVYLIKIDIILIIAIHHFRSVLPREVFPNLFTRRHTSENICFRRTLELWNIYLITKVMEWQCNPRGMVVWEPILSRQKSRN